MAPVVPVRIVPLADQAQVRLVDQGGGLKRLTGRLVAQLLGGELAQLVVDQRLELVGRSGVALGDGVQDLRDLAHKV